MQFYWKIILCVLSCFVETIKPPSDVDNIIKPMVTDAGPGLVGFHAFTPQVNGYQMHNKMDEIVTKIKLWWLYVIYITIYKVTIMQI